MNKKKDIPEYMEDNILLAEAEERMQNFKIEECITQDEIMKKLGITDSELNLVNVENEVFVTSKIKKKYLQSV